MSSELLQSLNTISILDPNDVVNLEIIESIESTAATLTRFVAISQNNVRHLIYKEFRPDWIGGGGAELTWYKKYAPSITPGISPKFYGGELDRKTVRCALFLEDISETHDKMSESWSAQPVDWRVLKQAVDLLLQLHIPWWNHHALKDAELIRPQGGPLRLIHATTPETITHYVQTLSLAFPDLVASLSPTLTAEWQKIYERVIRVWAQLLTKRLQKNNNLTLLHGDFHIWNIIYPRDPQDHPPLLVDWETYKRGIGVYDLAYLLITALDIPARRAQEKHLLRHYHNGLLSAGIKQYDWQECLQDYRLSIIANLFPPLMWNLTERINFAMMAFEDWNCMELLV
jgi:thiamine kinase-like enzyme